MTLADVAQTMQSSGKAEMGLSVNALPHVVIPLQEVNGRQSKNQNGIGIGVGFDADVMYTLQSGQQHGVALAFAENSRAEIRLCGGDGNVASQLTTGGGKPGQGQPCIASAWTVRRLTPMECERLQGFPDGYTLVPVRGKPGADGPRYKALGNSMAVNAMRWLGRRIDMVNDLSVNSDAA